jgi:hypothetical protein
MEHQSAQTIRRSRRRLLNRLFKLSQLDLFHEMDDETKKVVITLKNKITNASDELAGRRVA